MLENVFELSIDAESGSYLRETAKWARYFSILGFVCCAFILVMALIIPGIILRNPDFFQVQSQIQTQGMEVGLVVGSILGVAIYLYPCILLFRFSGKLLQALKTNDQSALNAAFKNLRSCYRFFGIISIIVIGIYALIFIIAMIGMAFVRR
jgi:hypothetical protein